jgi:hypothetical protein
MKLKHLIIAGSIAFLLLLSTSVAYAASILLPVQGGTGNGNKPTYGQMLVGNAGGTYTLMATSSLGITATFSTTSTDYWKTQRNFFATTSADYWETTQAPRGGSGGVATTSLSATYPLLISSGASTISFSTALSTTTVNVCASGCAFTNPQAALDAGFNSITMAPETFALATTLKIPTRNNIVLRGQVQKTLLQFNRSSVKVGMMLANPSVAVTGLVFQDFAFQATGAGTGGTCIDFSHIELSKFVHVDCLTAKIGYIASSSLASFYNTIDSPTLTIDGGYGTPHSSIGIALLDSSAIETTIINPRVRMLSAMSSSTGIYVGSHSVTCIKCDVETDALYGMYVDQNGSDLNANVYLEGNQTNLYFEASNAGVGSYNISGNIADASGQNIVDAGAVGLKVDARVQYAAVNYLTNGKQAIGTTTSYAPLSVWGSDTTANHRAFEVTNAASSTLFYVDNAGTASTSALIAANSIRAPHIGIDKNINSVIGIDTLVDGTPNTTGLRVEADVNTRIAYSTFVTSDPQLRFTARTDGLLSWGDGALAVDTNLFRDAANILRTNDSLIVDGLLGIATTTPGSALSVQGNIFLAGNLVSTSSIASIIPFASTTALSATTICLTGDTCRTTWPTGGGSAYPFPLSGNATSSPTMILASTTIGNGTSNSGLTVSGNATTTMSGGSALPTILKVFNTGAQTGQESRLDFGGYQGNVKNSIVSTLNAGGATSNLTFRNGATTALTIAGADGLLTFASASSTLFSASYASSTQWYGGGLGTCNSSNQWTTWSSGQFGCASLVTSGTWSGLAGTATALAADGANCSAGSYPLGVDASGAVQGCTVAPPGTVTAVTATWPIISSGGATPNLTWGGLSTSTASVVGNIPYFSGINSFANVATTAAAFSQAFSYSGTFGAVVGGAAGTMSSVQRKSFTYSTSTAWSGTTTIPLEVGYGDIWNTAQCYTDVGTLNAQVGYGTASTTMFNASTTIGTVSYAANNTMTAGNRVKIDIGTPASSPKQITCTFKLTI